MSSKQTLVVAPPPPLAGEGAVNGPFLAYFPSGAPEGVAADAGAAPPAAAAAPRFSVYRRNTAAAAAAARQQLMLVGHTVRER